MPRERLYGVNKLTIDRFVVFDNSAEIRDSLVAADCIIVCFWKYLFDKRGFVHVTTLDSVSQIDEKIKFFIGDEGGNILLCGGSDSLYSRRLQKDLINQTKGKFDSLETFRMGGKLFKRVEFKRRNILVHFYDPITFARIGKRSLVKSETYHLI